MNVSKIEIGSLLPMINSLNQNFTKSEKKVAYIVTQNPKQVMYSSITDLAEIAGVGDTTIIRFCRKLGFKGYQNFKMALAQEISSNNNASGVVLNEEILDDDTTEEVIQKLYAINSHAMQETLSLLKQEQVLQAIKIIEKSKKVHFYGIGASGVTALDAKYKFMRIGLNVDSFTDGHIMAMDASLMGKEDTVIGISYSGSTKDTLDALKIAQQAGANTICITHHTKSPITQYADIILLTGSREGPLQGGAVTTKIAQLFVIDILYTEVFRANKQIAGESKKKTGDAIAEKLF